MGVVIIILSFTLCRLRNFDKYDRSGRTSAATRCVIGCSTEFSAAENSRIRLGGTVAVFAQGPMGLCATLGARFMGASEIFAVDPDAGHLQVSERLGAIGTLNANADPLNTIREWTRGRGVDVAIRALGTQET